VPGDDANERDYDDQVSEELTVTNVDLRIEKTGPATILPGDTITYTLDFYNDGNLPATNVTITDEVPVGTTFNAAGSSSGWSCTDGDPAGTTCTLVTPDLGSGSGQIPAGSNGSVTFSVIVNDPLAAGIDVISNTTTIEDDGAHGPDPTPDNNEDTWDSTNADATPDLLVTKTDNTDYVAPGATLVYQIEYQNIGNQDATGVVITETVPDDTTFDADNSDSGWVEQGTSDPCADGAPAGTVCEYTVGDLDAGEDAVSVTFAVNVDDPLDVAVDEIINTVTIEDDGTNGDDSDPDNNEDTDTDTRLDTLSKSLFDTNQAFTTGTDAAIGEILTYQFVIEIPPHDPAGVGSGLVPNLKVTDDLDRGLAFVSCVGVTASQNLTTDLVGGFDDACSPDPNSPTMGNPAIYPIPQSGDESNEDVNQGRRIVFDFGNVTNNSTDTSEGAVETITVEYQVVVLDSAGNLRDEQLNNLARAEWGQDETENQLLDDASDVTLLEPNYTLSKQADRSVANPGTIITFTLEVAHAPDSNIDAFDVILTDRLPPELTYVPGTLLVASGLPADVVDDSDPNALQVTWDQFPLGETARVEYQAELGRITSGGSVENTANLEWTSLPGDFVNPPNAPQSEYNLLSTERWYDPASTVDIYGISASWSISHPSRGKALPETGFAPGRVTELPARPSEYELETITNMSLELPSLDVSVPIVGIPLDSNGWNLTWLSNQAGYLETTAYPTWEGNTVLTAHAYLADGLPGPFVALGSLKWGDQVILYAHNQRYIYEVRESTLVMPNDFSIMEHKERDWLTLFTCYQYDESSDQYLWRHVVQAVLIDVESLE
jgi:LPXTG-site transpeptidase (sortase) family protein